MPHKDNLIGQVNHVKNNFILGLAATTLLTEPKCRDYLDSSWVQLGEIRIDFPGLKEWIVANHTVIPHLITCHARLLIGDSFELIRQYSKESGQSADMKKEDWYWFAYMIRCTFFHGGKIDYRLAMPEVQWCGLALRKEMHGNFLSLEIFPSSRVWSLFQAMERFVHEKLK